MNTLLVWIAMVGVLVSAQSGAGKAELDATVHVRVVALCTGEPLEGVWVWAGRKPFDGTPSEFMFGLSGGESNASRAYQSMGGVGALVQTPASGEVDLRVTSGPGLWIAAMGSSGDQARLDPLASGARTELDFELRSGRTRYQGLVRERVSGAPVGGARIEGLDFDAHMLAETKTDAAGRFCLDGESLAEVRIGGHVAMIGALTGAAGFSPISVFMKAVRLQGIFVGSRAMFEDMNNAISVNKLKPAIDKVFSFDEIGAALKYMESGSHFGKIVVKF